MPIWQKAAQHSSDSCALLRLQLSNIICRQAVDVCLNRLRVHESVGMVCLGAMSSIEISHVQRSIDRSGCSQEKEELGQTSLLQL